MNWKKFFRRKFKIMMMGLVSSMLLIFGVPAPGKTNMFNLDEMKQQKTEIMQKIAQAIKDDNTDGFVQAWDEMQEVFQKAILAEANGIVQAADNTVLTGRGVRALTSEETKYYQKLTEAMRSANPQQALSGFDSVLPKTVIDAVFEDITETHPLLDAIKFENAAALIEYLYSTMDGRFLATWGKLCSTVTQQLSAQFHKLSLTQTKLSAFIPVCKAMLDLGPAWLDRYVRTILLEAIANGLEDGIISGRGVAEGNPAATIYEPIGMAKDLTNYDVALGYANKVAIPIFEFSPENYGGLLAQLAVGPNLLNRTVTEVLLVVNPIDYLTKIMPATVYQTPQGTYARDIFPFPTKVVQSAYVTQGKALLGIGKRYLMALGTGKEGKIEYSDEYKFLEDERYYLIKLYGTGRPLDNTSFLYLDISNLRPVHPIVKVSDYVDARLSGIELTDELTNAVNLGVINENIHYYAGAVADVAVASDNNVAVLEVTPKDVLAVIAVSLNGVPLVAEVDGSFEVTLVEGPNVIVITSAIAGIAESYVLVVTYTAIA